MSSIKLSPNASGTGIFTVAAPATNTDRTLTLPDNSGTILTTATAGVPVNGPAFRAYANSNLSITGNVSTKVLVNTIDFDTNNAFDTTNRWFKPSVAGYYQISYGFESPGTVAGYFIAQLRKNGVIVGYGSNFPTDGTFGPASVGTGLYYLNGSTDYIELYAQSSNNRTITGNIYCTLNGFLARAA